LSRRKNIHFLFGKFCNRYLEKGYQFHETKKCEIFSPNNSFSVIIRPAAIVISSGKPQLPMLWSTKTPPLNPRMAAIGLELMNRGFGLPEGGAEYAIVDLWRGGTFFSEKVSKAVGPIIAGEFAFGDAFFKSAEDEKQAAA
jgi:hypothetical protein